MSQTPQSNIGSIVIESNLDYDHQIIWIEFLAFLEVVFFVVLFINLSILMIFTQTLVPIDNIIHALTHSERRSIQHQAGKNLHQ